jgi:tagaturonate reductase
VAGLNVVLTTDESPYHQRKVTLLNGPHTVLSPVAFLAGLDIVRDACQHEVIGPFVRRVMYDELLPTLLPAVNSQLSIDNSQFSILNSQLSSFADDVMERFCNPFVDHQLTSIMLNSFSKFVTRDLPALKTYFERRGTLPKGIVLGLAAICVYYRGGQRPDGTPIHPNDDPAILRLLADLWEPTPSSLSSPVVGGSSADISLRVAAGVLAAQDLIWHEHGDLNAIPGLTNLLAQSIQSILDCGMMETVRKLKD